MEPEPLKEVYKHISTDETKNGLLDYRRTCEQIEDGGGTTKVELFQPPNFRAFKGREFVNTRRNYDLNQTNRFLVVATGKPCYLMRNERKLIFQRSSAPLMEISDEILKENQHCNIPRSYKVLTFVSSKVNICGF